MASMFQKAGNALRGATGNPEHKDQDGESLTTILETDEDRGALTLLICDITEHMRKQIIDTFDPKETGSGEQLDQFAVAEEQANETNADHDGSQEREQQQKLEEKRKAEQAKREKEVNEQSMVELKESALSFFDNWRDSVIVRVGEVINARKNGDEKPKSRPKQAATEKRPDAIGMEKDQHDTHVDDTLQKVYAPVETPLRNIEASRKALILHSVLLLMLSLEHYNAYSRILLLRLAVSLGLSIKVLSEEERKVAHGLLTAAKQMSAEEETKQRADDNRTARKWKMGAAGVAGAALIGITGGLAAPLLAAGVGTVLGGIGLGATATAGYLGALAGSSVLVGGLFGAYGARMSTIAMDQYTRDVEDFAFVPTRESKDQTDVHRLRVAIGVSGWLSDESEVTSPWKVIGDTQEAFALRFEVESLKRLGNSLRALITSVAWKVAKSEIIKRTVFAALMAGLWPLSLTNAGKIIDNPWTVANQRAQKAGEVLAEALINKAQGERPVTLVGYSLGAKVIYVCLQQLARRKAFGLVENVVLCGAPTPSNSADWRRIRSVVTGRVVNAYSTQDYILAFLYRSSSIQFGVAGLHPIAVKGVENINASDTVEGHTLYRHATGTILGRIGFEDIDVNELAKEKRRLDEQEKQEREQRENAENTPQGRELETEMGGSGSEHGHLQPA
ncbi:DUF726-domain-containing protein [Xylariaceae sp. FL1019]|nr:DUF726-domain-containing protein [Xylariaceae sp. FL1019]